MGKQGVRRAVAVLGIMIAGGALAPSAVAFADDGDADAPSSPAIPIIRHAPRGIVMSGVGDERVADMRKVQGGVPSRAGQAIVESDGHLEPMPVIKGGGKYLCSSGQPRKKGVLNC